MSEPAADAVEVETAAIMAHLVAERVGPSKPALAVHEMGLLRRVAHMLATDTGDARDITSLLDLAPKIVSPGARPAPTLAQVTRDDAPLDLSRLSTQQLLDLEHISAVLQGRACPVTSPRMEACQRLAGCLDEGGDPAIDHVRGLLTDILAPLTFDAVHPSYRDELEAERTRRVGLQRDVERLEHALSHTSTPLPANVASLAAARARAEREAPITQAGSSGEKLSGMVTGADPMPWLGA